MNMARSVAPNVVLLEEQGLARPKHLRLRETPDECYEHHLDEDLEWALKEGSRHFEEKSAVHDALRRIAQRLDELGIPYAIAGGMALFMHGYRRFTEDVDILVAKEDIKRIHESLEGRGYRPPFENSKNLRDTENQVRIEFLLSGGFPGDGKPKPVAFPEPAQVSIEQKGIRVLRLPTLIELKLASGMTSSHRGKDIIDVQELIQFLELPLDFAAELNPYVRDKYQELWRNVHGNATRYVLIWRNEDESAMLETMLKDGVNIESQITPNAGCLYLVTTDPDVARKYDMYDESEMMPNE
jgi:hypothetical protein